MRASSGGHILLTTLFFLVSALFGSVGALFAAPYPGIERANRGDPLFVQHQNGIERYYRASAQGDRLPPLRLYEYRVGGERSLNEIAARFTLPVETIATLNRLPSTEIPEDTERILIPSLPGLFVSEFPENRFEELLRQERRELLPKLRSFTVLVRGSPVRFRFIPEERLSGTEQLHFLGSFFRPPLREASVTSRFGYRTHPLFGFRSFHRGVDFRSPRGASVYAAAAGTVSQVGRDGVLGLHVVLEHDGGYRTTYAHLSEVTVSLKDELLSGSMLGKVGSTGISTGPHLHFEITQGDRFYDPLDLLPQMSQ